MQCVFCPKLVRNVLIARFLFDKWTRQEYNGYIPLETHLQYTKRAFDLWGENGALWFNKVQIYERNKWLWNLKICFLS